MSGNDASVTQDACSINSSCSTFTPASKEHKACSSNSNLSTFTPAPIPKKRKKKFKIDIRNMGVNIDKNEYYEIKLSNSAHPERGL